MATMIHRTGTADRARHGKLEKLLGLQGAVLRNRRHLLREGQPSGVMDLEERALDAEEQSVGFTLLELTSQTVNGIETALQRLEAGTFGTCSDCRCRIGGARLRALSFAARCLSCQGKHDFGAVGAARAAARWSGPESWAVATDQGRAYDA